MSVIYHIAAQVDWEAALARGVYVPTALATPEFILCAHAEQYPALATTLFGASSNLCLLFIDTDRLGGNRHLVPIEVAGLPALRLDGPLPLTAVFEIADYRPDANGQFRHHHETRALTVRGDDHLEDVERRALHVMASFDRPWWIAGGAII